MSGFEIVGVVLGAIPILMKAISCYDDAEEIYSRLAKYKQEKKLLKDSIDAQCNRLKNVCKRLLQEVLTAEDPHVRSLIRDSDHLNRILAGNSRIWRSSRMTHYMERRLDTSYQSVLTQMRQASSTITAIRLKLGCDENGELVFDKTRLAEAWRRGLFGLSWRRYEKLMKSLTQRIDTVKDLVEGSLAVELSLLRALVITPPNRSQALAELRENAVNAHSALRASLECSHRTAVALISWKGPDSSGNEAETPQSAQLSLILGTATAAAHRQGDKGSERPTQWQEVNVSCRSSALGQGSSRSSPGGSTHSSNSSDPSASRNGDACLCPLCPRTAQSNHQLLCICRGEFELTSVMSLADQNPWPSQRLGGLLGNQDWRENMHSRHRLTLAQSVSRGMLYYRETPWIATSWSSAEVCIFKKHDHHSYDHMCTSSAMPRVACQAGDDTNDGFAWFDPKLVALCVALVEISLWSPIINLQTEADRQGAGDLANFKSACRILKSGRVRQQLRHRYSKVVDDCRALAASMGTPRDEVDQTLSEKVVAVLGKELAAYS